MMSCETEVNTSEPQDMIKEVDQFILTSLTDII